MQNLTELFSSNSQIYVFILSALIIFLMLAVFCVYCNKKNKLHRADLKPERSLETFIDVPLVRAEARQRSLSTFLASAQEQVTDEKSVVKQALLGLVTEKFDEPAINPRTVSFIGRKSLANLHRDIPNFHLIHSSDDSLERQYRTVNASYKYSQGQGPDKSLEVIYANFETVTLNLKKKETFGSEQMILKKSSIEEPPALAERFTVHKSEQSIPTEVEGGEKKKRKPYEHLHLNDEKKAKHQYENHEIINKSRGFVNPL